MFRPKNYEIFYRRGDVEVVESYDKSMKYYSFTFKYDDLEFRSVLNLKYSRDKKLVEDVEVYMKDESKSVCVLAYYRHRDEQVMCAKDGKFVDLALIEEDTSEFYEREEPRKVNEKFKNIEVYSKDLGSILVWGLKGYYYIGKDKSTEIEFLKNESYYNNLAYQKDEFIITPDYDSEYTFNKFYIVNLENGKLTDWKFDYNISFNSYYLGTKDDKVYLFDRKQKCEYAIDVKRKKIEIVSKDGKGIVWNKGFEEVSTTKLAQSDYVFKHDQVYNYKSNDGIKLKYFKSRDEILLSDRNADILSNKGDTVYYLDKDTVYAYNNKFGEVKLASYSEWQFNDLNAVFIY